MKDSGLKAVIRDSIQFLPTLAPFDHLDTILDRFVAPSNWKMGGMCAKHAVRSEKPSPWVVTNPPPPYVVFSPLVLVYFRGLVSAGGYGLWRNKGERAPHGTQRAKESVEKWEPQLAMTRRLRERCTAFSPISHNR